MNPHAKMRAAGTLPSGLLGGQLLGGRPPMPMQESLGEFNPNACAVHVHFLVSFADGSQSTDSPAPVGTDTGNLEEILTKIDDLADQLKQTVKLKFAQRGIEGK